MRITISLGILLVATSAQAAILTITPDQPTYSVGETITLSVHGDAEGAPGFTIFGRILFDESLASPVSASQTPLTSFNDVLSWDPAVLLESGSGFATAFSQIAGGMPLVPDGPLEATVVMALSLRGSSSSAYRALQAPPSQSFRSQRLALSWL